MTELSFPVVNQSLAEDQWAIIGLSAMGMGIVDRGGNPYNIASRSDVNNTITIGLDAGTGKNEAVVRGFVHRIDTTKVLSVPTVASDTTYEIGLVYDPALHGTVAGPISLAVWTAPGSSANGVVRLVLYRVLRKPGVALTATTIEANRQRAVPMMEVSGTADLGSASRYLGGTMCYVSGTSQWYRVAVDGSGVRSWVEVGTSLPPISIAETGNSIPQRTSSGTVRGANPTHAQDLVPRQWFLDQTELLRTATGSNDYGTLVKRSESDGGFLVVNPVNAAHPATKAYVDGKNWAASDITSGILNRARIDGSTHAYNNIQSGTNYTISVNSSGLIARFSSKRSHKARITDAELDTARGLLNVNITRHVRRASPSGPIPDDARWEFGVIADDELVREDGVPELVLTEPETPDVAEGWDWTSHSALLTLLVQHQDREQQRLDRNQRIIAAKLGLTYDDEGNIVDEEGTA